MKNVNVRKLFLLVTTFFVMNDIAKRSYAIVGDESVSEVHSLFGIAYVVVGLITAGYMLIMVFFFIRYRNSPNREVSVWSLKKQNKYILIWTVIMFGLVGVEALVESPVTELITEPAEHVDGYIHVQAHQFQFQFLVLNETQEMANLNLNFTAPGPESPSLVLEAGKVYKVNVTSVDVIHSFFIKDLAFRMDAIPGRYNVFYLTIKNTGDYEFYCTEFCGAGHYTMHGFIRVT